MLQCGKPGLILVLNAYASKTTSYKGACTDTIKGKTISYLEGENFLILQILNIFIGHFHTLHTPFALHWHSWT